MAQIIRCLVANGILKPIAQGCGIKASAAAAKKMSSASDQVPTDHARTVTRANGLTSEARERECRSANGHKASPERWLRAVENFRSYEADLNRRVDKSK